MIKDPNLAQILARYRYFQKLLGLANAVLGLSPKYVRLNHFCMIFYILNLKRPEHGGYGDLIHS